jgi:hypothetical protein
MTAVDYRAPSMDALRTTRHKLATLSPLQTQGHA